jgi:hypothetical protein
MSLNSREFLIWKERGRGVREGGVGGQVSRQAYLRLGYVWERLINRGEKQRYREIQRNTQLFLDKF